jgi:hypothetical protein
MKTRVPSSPLVSAQSILTFTALSQIVLYLWVTGRITGGVAASALTGVVLFAVLARAVREVLAAEAPDVDDCGPVTTWKAPPAGESKVASGARRTAPRRPMDVDIR